MSVNDLKRAAVVLLANPGPAREKLRQAVANAGGELVLEAVPAEVAPAQVLSLSPAAVVIALDADTDDALDALEPELTRAGVTLLLEEADLAAQREGWDTQRWERHLAAKLLGHADVLPPGAEAEPLWQPEPGLPTPPAQLHADARIEPHLEQARDLVDGLPGAGLALNDPGFDDAGFDYRADPAMPDSDVAPSLEQLLAQMPASPAPAAGPLHTEAAVDQPDGLDAPQPAPGAAQPPPLPPLPDAAPAAAAPATPALSQWSLVDFDQDVPVVAAAPSPAPAIAKWDLDGLSLVDLDAAPDACGGDAAATDSSARASTVALLMAGIGGPDAIRRMLAVLPAEGMPGAVLVQLRLDGGRYANLVTQLERVCAAPVQLAEAGRWLAAGHVYVLGDDITVEGGPGDLRFARLPAGASVLSDLPAKGSAVIMLSGAEAERVDAVIALAGRGAWVAGQSGEGCYDPAAASALAVSGMPIGEPSWLAAELLGRWGL